MMTVEQQPGQPHSLLVSCARRHLGYKYSLTCQYTQVTLLTHTTTHTSQKFHSAVKDSIRQAKRRGKYAFDAGRYSEAAQWYSEALTLGESAPDPEEITQEQVLYKPPKPCVPEPDPQPLFTLLHRWHST